jgi:hypothetical protein
MLKQATCQSCRAEFTPKRDWQSFCSRRCSNRDAQRRARGTKCADRHPAVSRFHKCADTAPSKPSAAPGPNVVKSYGWGEPGDPPLLGDGYELQYYPDGYPVIPACLDRRASKDEKEAQPC